MMEKLLIEKTSLDMFTFSEWVFAKSVFHYANSFTIDLFRGACAVKANIPVAGHVKRVDHGYVFDS